MHFPIIGKANRERGIETNSSIPNDIKTRKDLLITVVIRMIKTVTKPTVTVTIKNVPITTSILDTENALTKRTVTMRITTIEDIGMSTRAIGNPGNNGTVT